jgi:MFS family permease
MSSRPAPEGARRVERVPSAEIRPAPARDDVRHNLLALGADFSLFLVGLSFASQSTILPAFAETLGASNLVIGAIPALMTVGWFMPSLLAAGHTETLRHRLPFVLRWTVWERVPFAALALLAFFVAGPAPALARGLLLALLLFTTAVGGILMPAWMDIVGRTIPTHLRGRFFGITSLVANAGGMLGSIFTAWVLAAVAAPASYGWCFAAAAVCMALSYAALAVTREPPVTAPAAAVPLRTYLRRIPGLLRRDRNFRRFLVARTVVAGGTMAPAFYTVYALRALGAEAWQVGVFTSVLLSGQMVGNLVLGWLADRRGHLLVIALGAAAMGLASATALAATSLEVYAAVFALTGVLQAAANVSNLNVLLEFAPTVEERPTYVGLGTTAVAPMVFAAPLLGGLVADAAGFRAVFALGGALGAVGLVLVLWLVRDPRHLAT